MVQPSAMTTRDSSQSLAARMETSAPSTLGHKPATPLARVRVCCAATGDFTLD